MIKKHETILHNILAVLIWLPIVITPASNAKIYYVAPNGSDNNAGTIDRPFQTIQKAVNLTQPGDTVYVRNGVYVQTVTIKNSGTINKPITITAYPSEHPVIDGEYQLPSVPSAGWGGCNNRASPAKCFHYLPLVDISGSYVVLDGFEIQRSLGRGIEIEPNPSHPTGIVVRNNRIHDLRETGVLFYHAANAVFEGNDVWFSGNYAPFDRPGSVLNWPGAVDGMGSDQIIFRKNRIFNNWGEGLDAGIGATNITIEDNEVYDNFSVQIYMNRTVSTVVQRNLVYCTNAPNFRRANDIPPGIVVNNEPAFADQSLAKDITAVNNVVVGCKENFAVWEGGGGGNDGVTNLSVSNNTFINAHSIQNENRGVGINILPDNHHNIQVKHNIVLQDTALLAYAPDPSVATFSTNLWSRTPPAQFSSGDDAVGDPLLQNPRATLIPGQMQIEWYKTKPNSPFIARGMGPYEYFNNAKVLAASIGASTSTIPSMGTSVGTDGLVALYQFEEGSGVIVHDSSDVGPPLDLTITDSSAVKWLPGALAVESPVRSVTQEAGKKIICGCQHTNEITLEAWIKPAITYQKGPARIIALSSDIDHANFALGQGLWNDQSLYTVRLRTTQSELDGRPSLASATDSARTDLTHVVYVRNKAGLAMIYINGQQQASEKMAGEFINWDDTYRLVLANDPNGDDPWLGEYHFVAIYTRALTQAEISRHFVAGLNNTKILATELRGNLFLPIVPRTVNDITHHLESNCS